MPNWNALSIANLMWALAVLVGVLLVQRLLGDLLERLGTRYVHRRLLLQQVGTITRFLVWAIAFGLVVAGLHPTRDMMLAISGTAAVTVGFALKDLAASVLAGIIIIFDKPFQVGDRVSFDGYYGEITSIGLRSVRLTTLDDNQITIPNNKFLTDSVSSGNAGALDMLIQMDFHIGSDQDVALAKRIVSESLVSNRYVYAAKPWVVLVSQVIVGNCVAIRLRAKAYVLDVKFEKALETDVTERVLAGFAAAGIRGPAILHRLVGDGPGETVLKEVVG